ncbi:MAG: hypothetical protein AB1445_09015 [Bacillota bacterium]
MYLSLLNASLTERELDKIVAATTRPQRPLRGEAAIGMRVGRVLGRFKMGKDFPCTISPEGFRYERDEASIAAEAALDGIYVIRTNVPAATLSDEDTVRTYQQLAKVERAFRMLKGADLKVKKLVEVQLFCMRLCYSGAPFVVAFPLQRTEFFLEGHTLGTGLGLALRNARLYRQLQAKAAMLERLIDLGQALAGHLY